MKYQKFLAKNHRKIEYGYVGILVAVTLICCLLMGVNHRYKNNTPVSISTTDGNYTYDNFWHKFNTFSVVMVGMKSENHLVSQNEIQNFQAHFFSDLGLKVMDKTVTDNIGQKVKPDMLFCYMKNYEPNQTDRATIINICK